MSGECGVLNPWHDRRGGHRDAPAAEARFACRVDPPATARPLLAGFARYAEPLSEGLIAT